MNEIKQLIEKLYNMHNNTDMWPSHDDVQINVNRLHELVNENDLLPLVSNRKELLFAFEEYWNKNNCDGENFSDVVDKFLANNSC